jgi:hypothetical protein
LTNSDIKRGIKNMVLTGISISKTEIPVPVDKKAGIKNGRRKAIVKLLKIIEMTANSILPLNRFIIIGEAIAVGAIAVINAASANFRLNPFKSKNRRMGTAKFINNK